MTQRPQATTRWDECRYDNPGVIWRKLEYGEPPSLWIPLAPLLTLPPILGTSAADARSPSTLVAGLRHR